MKFSVNLDRNEQLFYKITLSRLDFQVIQKLLIQQTSNVQQQLHCRDLVVNQSVLRPVV